MPSHTDYQPLGVKTLWLFIFERSTVAVLALVLSIAMFVLFNVNIPMSYQALGQLTVNFHEIVRIAALGFLFLFCVALAGAILAGWLVYINYKFFLGEDALKIKRGILSKEEIAIPYRQIQDVNIRRDVSFMMFGLSKIIIQSAGRGDRGGDDSSESEGTLPAIDKDLAEKLQEELLKRANVEKVIPANQ